MDLTPLETSMLRDGYVSARMLAARLGFHVSTINRLVRLDKLPSREAGARRYNAGGGLSGPMRFVSIKDAVEYYGPEISRRFGLDTWKG